MKINDPRKYGDYEATDIAFVIKMSSMLKSQEEISRKYSDWTHDRKTMSGKVIQEIQADYASKIQMATAMYSDNVEGSPYNHPRLVVDMYDELKLMALSLEKTVRVSKDDWEAESIPDIRCAKDCIDAAVDYLMRQEKLIMEKLKKNASLLPSEPASNADKEELKPNTSPAEGITWKME